MKPTSNGEAIKNTKASTAKNPKPVNRLQARTLNQVILDAASKPPRKPIFGDIITEGDLHIFNADTGLGKSILGYQIGIHNAIGKPIQHFAVGEPKMVLYYCFELSDSQILKRFTNKITGEVYNWGKNFIRLNIPDISEINLEKEFIESLKLDIDDYSGKLIIIDNLTFISDNLEKSEVAARLQKRLKRVCREKNVTIIVISHPPKVDNTKILDTNSVAGSKKISIIADSMSTLGESFATGHEIYFKHIKSRDGEKIYTTENVLLCKRVHEGFLKIEFLETDSEYNHLYKPSPTVKPSKKELYFDQIVKMKKDNPNMSNREIAKKLDIDEKSVRNWLNTADTSPQSAL